MVSTARFSYVRLSARKARYVVDLVRNKSVNEALSILNRTQKKGAIIVQKLIQSAVANAKTKSEIDQANLKIAKITADTAPMFKRWRSMSMGRAGMIRKRMSHLLIELDAKGAPKTQTVSETRVAKTKDVPATKVATKKTTTAPSAAKKETPKKLAKGAK